MNRRILLRVLAAALIAGCSQPPPTRSNPHLLHEAERAMLQGQWDRAASQYEAFLAENPGDAQRAEIRMQAGKCRLGGGQPEPAIRAFDQALLDQPPAPLRWEILFRRAVALRMQGDAARALEGFRSVAAAPSGERGRSVTNDELHYEYAMALFRAGDFKGGQTELRLVNAAGPYGKQVAPRLGLSGYSVQVGAFGREDDARAEAGKLNAAVRPLAGPPLLYLVLVGSFPKYEDAQRELAKLQRQGYTDAFILP
ncbi:MAG: tetratricopeptide repeat protein [Planctomycetes bacterium]|nr:tetratricopeptide repeat protein [Planctomycetota bacterium]